MYAACLFFVHQEDPPLIPVPVGLSGVPAHGIVLTPDIPDDIFALVQITLKRPTDSDFSFIDSSEHQKAICPVYQIRLKNRLTTWKYFNKTSRTAIPGSGGLYPLTFYGNPYVGLNPDPTPGFINRIKPSTNRIAAELDNSIPPTVTKLVSEIFI